MEIDKIENGQTIEKISVNKSWFLENSNKIDILLARVTMKQRENSNEKGVLL